MFKPRDPRHRRMMRGQILQLIYMAWQTGALPPEDPQCMSRNILVMTLEELKLLPSSEHLRADLHYLEGKGYLDAEWRRDGSGDFDWVRLTEKGVDVVEESATDPGVTLPRRQ